MTTLTAWIWSRTVYREPRVRPPGFTITELIIVISLAAITLGAVLPGVSAMRHMNQTKAATNAIGTAVTAARAFASSNQADFKDTGDPAYAGFTYSGVAILFTPAGELRVVENQQNAEVTAGSDNFLESLNRNGYRDIPGRDYIRLPRDSGVVGIARNATGLLLLTPPFAIRFTEHGSLVAALSSSDRLVYYDGDYDNGHGTSARGSYDSDDWDPNVNSSVGQNQGRYLLPFEEIETVVGVMVYSKRDLRGAGFNHDGTGSGINTAARDWILANGESIFFSRHTGTLIKR